MHTHSLSQATRVLQIHISDWWCKAIGSSGRWVIVIQTPLYSHLLLCNTPYTCFLLTNSNKKAPQPLRPCWKTTPNLGYPLSGYPRQKYPLNVFFWPSIMGLFGGVPGSAPLGLGSLMFLWNLVLIEIPIISHHYYVFNLYTAKDNSGGKWVSAIIMSFQG